jgi:hypothetical protein
MRTRVACSLACGFFVGALTLSCAPGLAQPVQQTAAQGQPTPQQRAEMLRQWLAASQRQLRAYDWIETTVVRKGGEEKSSTQKHCYYGADGFLQKIILQHSEAPEGGPPGILPFGRLIKRAEAQRKEELTDYMQNAAQLVHSYIPPDPVTIQRAVQSGKLAMQILEPNRRVRLTFGDYFKPGDSLGLDVELPTNRLLAMSVATYLDDSTDPVSLAVTMSVLPDGTIYAAHSVLDAKAKDVTVTIDNTGYRRLVQ